MAENYVIRVQNLGKKYKVGRRQRYRMLRDIFLQGAKSALALPRKLFGGQEEDDAQTLWALKDLDFTIQPGDSVGIIGNNGAGKSTLLKILSRVTVPTTGNAHLRGRVGSLLEVGTGFHPELTGRENVYLNGAILGMRKAEIDRKFDEIVAFSEVEKFLDTPVKFYSSGMRVRLAFSVAAHLEPEILLVDEVLAVGDVAFQKKSISRMEQVAKEGRTVLFVSHNMAAVRALCKTGLYLDKGSAQYIGHIDDAIKNYLDTGLNAFQGEAKIEFPPNPQMRAQLLSIELQNDKGFALSSFSYEVPFVIELTMAVRVPDSKLYVVVDILDEEMKPVISSYDFEATSKFIDYRPGRYNMQIKVPPLLVPGEYRLSVRVIRKGKRKEKIMDTVQEICPFEIIDSGSGKAQAGIRWSGKISTLLAWKTRWHKE